MKVNDFNSKINLPKFCAKLGYTDYQFVRLPTFGWFAYNKDKTFIGNIFDLVSPEERDKLYATLTKSKSDYLEFDMPYTSFAEKTLKNNLMEVQLWKAAYAFAKKEMQTYHIKGKKEKLSVILEEQGFASLVENGVGVISQTLLERFNMLPWPKRDMRGKLLIPTFHTPHHISSLEYCAWDDPSELYTLFVNGEKGWYGNIEHGAVVNGLFDLWTKQGVTWDYKLDFWTSDIFTLDDDLSVPDCIRVWTEANNTVFDTSPIQKIVDAGKTSELQYYVAQLNLKQLNEVEEVTGEKLTDYWKKARETQVKIGGKEFIRRDNCYYTFRKGDLEQITNFAIDVQRIVKRGGEFYRIGMLHLGDKSAPFEIKEKYFNSNYMFQRGIKDKYLAAGLGVPLVFPAFANKALLIIDSFNSAVPIEVEEPTLPPTSSSEHGPSTETTCSGPQCENSQIEKPLASQ